MKLMKVFTWQEMETINEFLKLLKFQNEDYERFYSQLWDEKEKLTAKLELINSIIREIPPKI